tara:strand:- start:30 stop:302 length:273 start_codon:yes stop_codon:yes gene_type:complete
MTGIENLERVSGPLVLKNGVCDKEAKRDHAHEVKEVAEFYQALGEIDKCRHDADRGKKFAGEGQSAHSAISEKVLDWVEPDDAEEEADRD